MRIGFARIASFGEEAIDVFYVRDLFGMKIVSDKKLSIIHHCVSEILVKANKGSLFT